MLPKDIIDISYPLKFELFEYCKLIFVLNSDLEKYLEEHTTPETEVLYQLNRETHLKVLRPNMLSDHVQGVFLKLLSQMIQPKTILELGTYTGYSAICLCEGLQKGGVLHTIDINEELYDMQTRYFEQARMQDRIKVHIGNALEIIPELNEKFDMVFMDADKQNYSRYYDMLFDQLPLGAYIIADNTLWKGQVYQESYKDKFTEALRAFNTKVQNDPCVENTILPLRDGISIIRKIAE